MLKRIDNQGLGALGLLFMIATFSLLVVGSYSYFSSSKNDVLQEKTNLQVGNDSMSMSKPFDSVTIRMKYKPGVVAPWPAYNSKGNLIFNITTNDMYSNNFIKEVGLYGVGISSYCYTSICPKERVVKPFVYRKGINMPKDRENDVYFSFEVPVTWQVDSISFENLRNKYRLSIRSVEENVQNIYINDWRHEQQGSLSYKYMGIVYKKGDRKDLSEFVIKSISVKKMSVTNFNETLQFKFEGSNGMLADLYKQLNSKNSTRTDNYFGGTTRKDLTSLSSYNSLVWTRLGINGLRYENGYVYLNVTVPNNITEVRVPTYFRESKYEIIVPNGWKNKSLPFKNQSVIERSK